MSILHSHHLSSSSLRLLKSIKSSDSAVLPRFCHPQRDSLGYYNQLYHLEHYFCLSHSNTHTAHNHTAARDHTSTVNLIGNLLTLDGQLASHTPELPLDTCHV